MATYECLTLEKVKNIYGGYDCREWVEVEPQNTVSLLPPLTPDEAMSISIECCLLLGIAYGFRLIYLLV